MAACWNKSANFDGCGRMGRGNLEYHKFITYLLVGAVGVSYGAVRDNKSGTGIPDRMNPERIPQ